MQWQQPRWNKRYWELAGDDGKVIATLEQPSVWKREGRVVYEGRVLTFRSVGFWQTKMAVRDDATGVDIAEYRKGSAPAITFKTSRIFYWRRKGLWRSSYSFTATDNEDVVTFTSRSSGFFRSGASVTLSSASYKYPEVPVLLTFGWWLMLLAAAQSAAAAST